MNLYRTYLMCLLSVADFLVSHVLKKVDKWDGNAGVKKYDAAILVSEELIENHGFLRCPSCGWAVKGQDDHIKIVGSWCHNEDTIQQTGFDLDDIEEMQRAYEERQLPHADDYPAEPEMHPAIAERRWEVQQERLVDSMPGTPVDQLLGEDRWNQLR